MISSILWRIALTICCILLIDPIFGFRVLNETNDEPIGQYFRPYDKGFVGIYGDPSNFQRERINEGSYQSSDQELLFEGVSPRQSCPAMVGPFSDGSYYCTAREFGYCDRRSGTCFCNIGYQGVDCSDCQSSHFKIGHLCYPKKLCPLDCSGAGTCNFATGSCTCLPHRYGPGCENMLCSNHSVLCQTCTERQCLSCTGGYYLTGDSRVCSSCYDFDPRCAGCTKEDGCTVCADPLLTSVRRSGYRKSDPRLPFEEDTRELSITLPFGTKSPESFASAETFFVGVSADQPFLNSLSQSCDQGIRMDDTWDCSPYTETHLVCGHYGVFSFQYPNYVISESDRYIRMTVLRTGGGLGEVNISYHLDHITTNDSDVTATAPYTTSQLLVFKKGTVKMSFLISILEDNLVEPDEVFQVVLESPVGGGSLGAQYRTNVTIQDNDLHSFSAKLSKLNANLTRVVAGQRSKNVTINAVISDRQRPMRVGGELFFVVVENSVEFSSSVPSPHWNALGSVNPNKYSYSNTHPRLLQSQHETSNRITDLLRMQAQFQGMTSGVSYFSNGMNVDPFSSQLNSNNFISGYDLMSEGIGGFGASGRVNRGLTFDIPRGDPFKRLYDQYQSLSLSQSSLGSAVPQLSTMESVFSSTHIGQRLSRRRVCEVTDTGTGQYDISVQGIEEQGQFQMRVYHALPGGLKGEYFSDAFFGAAPVYVSNQGLTSASPAPNLPSLTRIDRMINFTWGVGRLLPRGSDHISIRWRGLLRPSFSDYYGLYISADDHVRLWVEGHLIIDHFTQRNAWMEPPRRMFLKENTFYEILLEYREVDGDAFIRFMWNHSLSSNFTVIPEDNLYSMYEVDRSPAIVVVSSDETYAPTTQCSGDGLFRGQVNENSTFSFCPRDRYYNMRDDVDDFLLATQQFSAELRLISDLSPMVNSLLPHSDGRYRGSGSETIAPELNFNRLTHCFDAWYVPQLAGNYSLSITFQSSPNNQQSEHVLGSPFLVSVTTAQTSAPYSEIHHLPTSDSTGDFDSISYFGNELLMEAGTCHNFTIVSRDISRNFKFQGGDNYEVYTYQVDSYHAIDGVQNNPTVLPTFQPSFSPTNPLPHPTSRPSVNPTLLPSSHPSLFPTFSPTSLSTLTPKPGDLASPPSDFTPSHPLVRYGQIFDHQNGNYTAVICPVISGRHEIHILLNGRGISNQPYHIMNPVGSKSSAMGRESYSGQAVDQSPYNLRVEHTSAMALTSSAQGEGLLRATVGRPSSFMVTVRDPYGNVLRNPSPSSLATVQSFLQESQVSVPLVTYPSYSFELTAKLDRSPEVPFQIWNYQNGSFQFQYTPKYSGRNPLSVFVNDQLIMGSPFQVDVSDGISSPIFSYATGPGLITGVAGEISYFQVFSFDLENNRKRDSHDIYSFNTFGASNFSGTLSPCPKPPVPNHPICDPFDVFFGHYFGYFVPLNSGAIHINVYLEYQQTQPDSIDPSSLLQIHLPLINSPFLARIYPSIAKAENSIVSGGALYQNTAGTLATISLHLRDRFGNLLESGGHSLESAALGVAVEWGTVQPFSLPIRGYPNKYQYRGFYSGLPNYYGTWTDNQDGSFSTKYNITQSGQYVLRLSLLEMGLNGTYFNTSDFGKLFNGDFNTYSPLPPSPSQSSSPWVNPRDLGLDVNIGDSISWTGDWARGSGNELPASDPFQSGFNANSVQGQDVYQRNDHLKGALGQGTYLNMFHTRPDSQIAFNFSSSPSSHHAFLTQNLTKSTRLYNFREEDWSARWVGVITAPLPEPFQFTVLCDSHSDVRLRIGGRGNTLNDSEVGELVVQMNATSNLNPNPVGTYDFTLPATNLNPLSPSITRSLLTREFLMEYAHFKNEDGIGVEGMQGEGSFLSLYWESPSTPFQLVPKTAFRHWRNISHSNLTIVPAPLSPSHSTVWGPGLSRGTVAARPFISSSYTNPPMPPMNPLSNPSSPFTNSFLLYARDQFGNLLQRGGDQPQAILLGPEGSVVRADVIDYQNSTYLLNYFPTISGEYLLYVMVGCCLPHPSVGVYNQLELSKDLRVQGSPFKVMISPSDLNCSRTIATGPGLLGGYAGDVHSFNVDYRDIYNNLIVLPDLTTLRGEVNGSPNFGVQFQISFTNLNKMSTTIQPDLLNLTISSTTTTIQYSLPTSGTYHMSVLLSYPPSNSTSMMTPFLPILGSPFELYIHPSLPSVNHTLCRGIGKSRGSLSFPSNNNFEVSLFDSFNNPLIHGGHKFYTRLIGGSSSSLSGSSSSSLSGGLQHSPNMQSNIEVTPTCSDQKNGRYSCSYIPLIQGRHELKVLLLNSSRSHPGGTGLQTYYFASEFIPNHFLPSPNDSPPTVSTFSSLISPKLSFSWPDGVIIPKSVLFPHSPTGDSSDHFTSLLGTGQSALWTGYLVPPISDRFSFSVRTRNLNVSVYLDSALIFESKASNVEVSADITSIGAGGASTLSPGSSLNGGTDVFMRSLPLQADSAYLLRVFASVGKNHDFNGGLNSFVTFTPPEITFSPPSASSFSTDTSTLSNSEWTSSSQDWNQSPNKEISIELLWATPNSHWAIIPQFYLYDSATDIPYSPFPVQIGL